MRLIVLVVGVVGAAAAVLTAIGIALMATERGRATTATVAERFDPQVTQVRRAIDPGVQAATKALRSIPIVSDRLPTSAAIDASAEDAVDAADAAIEAVTELVAETDAETAETTAG